MASRIDHGEAVRLGQANTAGGLALGLSSDQMVLSNLLTNLGDDHRDRPETLLQCLQQQALLWDSF